MVLVQYISHHCYYTFISNKLSFYLYEYFFEWNPSIAFLTLAQFVFVLRERSISFLIQIKFSLFLWYISYLLQYAIKDPKPDIMCYDILDIPYSMPSSQHVYMISVITTVTMHVVFWWKNKSFLASIVAFFMLFMSSFNCFIIRWCTLKQSIVTFLFAFIPTIIFGFVCFFISRALIDFTNKHNIPYLKYFIYK
jgi:hypothetical protein